MKNLYLVTTKGLKDYYVIANDPTEAEKALFKIFEEQDYGFSDYRIVKNIEIIGKSFKPDSRKKDKPFLSDKEANLLIVDDWKYD